MKYIAIIGYGVVGGGITAFLEENRTQICTTVGEDVEVKYIVDLRDFPESPYHDRVIHNIEPILADPAVSLVCETMGGAHPAYEYTTALFAAGKSVVTSNKEVVATFGDSLLAEAKRYGVQYAFEASVGGGIPVIRSFLTALSTEKITAVRGILNGTTNYILTRMKNEGKSYSEILGDAQKLGYAEANPAADVDGIDAMRKILILTALATGTLFTPEDVHTESMRQISLRDIEDAGRLGASVKYIAQSILTPDGVAMSVCPRFVPEEEPLAHVHDVYNGIAVTSTMLGHILYYGRGAGRLPTAAAVMADVCGVLNGSMSRERVPVFVRGNMRAVDADVLPVRRYIRFAKENAAIYDALTLWTEVTMVSETRDAFVTEALDGAQWSELIAALPEKPVATYRFL